MNSATTWLGIGWLVWIMGIFLVMVVGREAGSRAVMESSSPLPAPTPTGIVSGSLEEAADGLPDTSSTEPYFDETPVTEVATAVAVVVTPEPTVVPVVVQPAATVIPQARVIVTPAPTAAPTRVPTVVPVQPPTTSLGAALAASNWPASTWPQVERIVMCESGGRTTAVSPAGYVGLMQAAPWLHGPVPADAVGQLNQGYAIYLKQGWGAWPVCGRA